MDRSRYRFVSFIGGRILQAREIDKLQDIARGVDDNHLQTAFDLDALYADGATFNIKAVITPNTKTVTLTPIDDAKPMLVFVRGRWEILKSGEAPAVTLAPGETHLYLNWQLVKRTLADDNQLQDLTTNEATAEMGELVLAVAKTDDSARAVTTTEFEKNLVPVVLYVFTHTSTSLIQDAKVNVTPQALASEQTAGMVQTTTDNPVVASTDDPRLADDRTPLAGSVTNAAVRTPVRHGTATNADGTPTYDLTDDAGGIDSAKIIHLPGTQRLSDAVERVKTAVAAVDAALDAHEGEHLGSNTTHPFPTAADVGATPASHEELGLEAAHGLGATKNVGGFTVTRDKNAAASTSAAFAVKDQDGDLAKLTHDGDVFSKLAQAHTATALVEDGETSNGLGNGPLGLLSSIAKVLAAHVNKTSHKNPHGLTLDDLGYEDDGGNPIDIGAILRQAKAYTDTTALDVLAQAKTYADLVSRVEMRRTDNHAWWLVMSFGMKAGSNPTVPAFELAFGLHTLAHGDVIIPPEGFNGANMLSIASMGSVNYWATAGRFTTFLFDVQEGHRVRACVLQEGQSPIYGNANVWAVAWRTL